MSLDGTKKLPTLRPSRDIKLTGVTKPKKTLFTPNIPNRKRPTPSQGLDGSDGIGETVKKVNTQDASHKFKPISFKPSSLTQPQTPEGKRAMEANKRKNNVFVTTSIFSCGLAEKVIRKNEIDFEKRLGILPEDKRRTSNSTAEEHTPSTTAEDEYMDPYDDSIPRVLPLDKTMNTKGWNKYTQSRGDRMASQWNSNIRMLSPSWPGLDPTSATLGNGEVDKSLAADLFNTAEDKAQIIFLQIPNKFPIQRPRRPDETEIQYLTAQKHGKAELASLKQLPQGSVGKLQVHASGRVSIKIGDAMFNLMNATPAAFLQELVVIDHPPGSAQGQLTHLGYLSGRMICAPDLEALASQSQPT